jgi:perosamine synthetase
MGKFGTFSFHGTKTITTGEGGMLVTRDPTLYERVLTLSHHGRAPSEKRQFWPERIGYKYRLSNLQAAIGCAQMERIGQLLAGKRRVFEFYSAGLRHLPIRMNPEPAGTVNGYWMPTVVVDAGVPFDRSAFLDACAADEVDGRVFFWPLSMLPMFANDARNAVSYALYSRAVNLPSYHDLTEAEMMRVISLVCRYVER